LRPGRLLVPAKITSSMSAARSDLCEVSPITQRSASTRLDLPQPFGPTTPVRPGSIRKSVGSTKDLKPRRRSRVSFILTVFRYVWAARTESFRARSRGYGVTGLGRRRVAYRIAPENESAALIPQQQEDVIPSPEAMNKSRTRRPKGSEKAQKAAPRLAAAN